MRVVAWILATVSLVVGLSACRPAGEAAPEPSEPAEAVSPFWNVAEDVAFVGDAACFDCHEDLWRGYQDHGMARSYYRLTPESAVEPFPSPAIRHSATDLTYRAFRRGDRFFQEEYRLNAAGDTTHHLVREMEFVMGSGNAARTYMSDEGGRLYELPLTWYSQGRRWDLSPGYEIGNKRFDRLVPDRCMACHNSYPESVPYVEGKYASVPEGIGCERCHGPGALHVEARLEEGEVVGEEDGSGIDPTIVNPAHLELDRQLDVCQQCHLHTTVSLLREDREPFGFRPSQDLARYLALFSTEHSSAEDEQIDVISHADRMKQSACFVATQATAEAMTCVTCHDPHEGFRDKGPAYFNETCLSCHAVEGLQEQVAPALQAEHAADANCYTCHMPKVEGEGTPHTSFTDHWIRVVEQEPSVALPQPMASHEPPTLVPYFEEDAEGLDAKRYQGMAYLVLAEQQGDSLAYQKGAAVLEEVLAEAPDHGEAQFLLGRAHFLHDRINRALPSLEAAVTLGPEVPERLNALAQAYEAARRDPGRTEQLYRRALEIQPALADVRLNYGRFLETQGRLDEALAQYRQAATEQPWLAAAHYNIGTALLQQGDLANAETALQQAITLQPDYVKALGNLGLLYASQEQPEKARPLFERALAAAPDDPVALANLGTYHLNTENLPQAIDLLRRAVEANPAYLDAILKLALASFRNNDFRQAETYARQALQLDPNNALARQILDAM